MDPKFSSETLADWPLPDEFLLELGRIAAMWASLESFLNLCIGKLAGFDVSRDPTSMILITHSSFPQRVHMLETLCEQLSPHVPCLKEYKMVVGILGTVQKLRNKYMHNGISYDETQKVFHLTIASARGKLKTDLVLVNALEIRLAALEVKKAMNALYELVLKNAPRA